MRQGTFITIEGGEGVGKTTQISLVAEALRSKGIKVVVTREPGGSAGAEEIRDMLKSGEAKRWSARTEALLFAAARCDHVERVIEPALWRGEWVLCDRYLDSSRAYQGFAGSLGDQHIIQLHRLGARLLPNVTILLDNDNNDGEKRAADRDGPAGGDRFDAQGPAYHNRVRNAFRTMAREDRYKLVNAQGPVENVTTRIIDALSPWIQER